MKRVDPGQLEGEELRRWYLRTPDEIEAERDAAHVQRFNEFFGRKNEVSSPEIRRDAEQSAEDDGRWQEARGPILSAPPLLQAPGDARMGIPNDTNGIAVPAVRGGFFDTHGAVDHPALGPAYITDLPRPLNVVTPKLGGWFELGDGSLVKGADEVERLHAEQQRRMRGQGEADPAATVRTADRLRDGFIPRADQLEKGQREKDVTCHPYGGWERDENFRTYPEDSQKYQAQITKAPDLDYVVRKPGQAPVKFDGCAVWDPRRQLLEAKGPGYAEVIEQGRRYGFLKSVAADPEKQAAQQARAAGGKPVEWHVAAPGATPFFADILRPYPSLQVRHTPVR